MEILWKLILLQYKFLYSNQVTNLHMPRQLSCRGMCKFMTQYDHYSSCKGKMYLYESGFSMSPSNLLHDSLIPGSCGDAAVSRGDGEYEEQVAGGDWRSERIGRWEKMMIMMIIQCRPLVVWSIFLQNIHNRHPLAHSWESETIPSISIYGCARSQPKREYVT